LVADEITAFVYADYICPWCYIATIRLLDVREQLKGTMRIVWKTFPIVIGEIHMPITKHSIDDRRTAGRDEARAVFAPWGDEGREYVSTSLRACEAAKCAFDQGEAEGERYHRKLYQAFFAESRDISDPGVLVKLALECGLDVARFGDAFISGRGREAVMSDYHEAREFWGALTNGVPLAVIGNTPLVGAVPQASYLKVADHVRREAAMARRSGGQNAK
jgi:predicted DsbA family dithiol-disulfide isomerase